MLSFHYYAKLLATAKMLPAKFHALKFISTSIFQYCLIKSYRQKLQILAYLLLLFIDKNVTYSQAEPNDIQLLYLFINF